MGAGGRPCLESWLEQEDQVGNVSTPERLPRAREGPIQLRGVAETYTIWEPSLRKKNTEKYKIKYKSKYLFRMRKVITITKKILKQSNITNITKSRK